MTVVINECHEPFVDLATVSPHFVLQPDTSRIDEPTMYVRQSVAAKLAAAERALPAGVTFVFNDAWRPRATQARYFDYYRHKIARAKSKLSEAEVYREAARFAIPPEDERRAGHMTGGAVDVELWSLSAGRRLPMRNRKLGFSDQARMDAAQRLPLADRNRSLLKGVLEAQGMVNYTQEYWHYSYGDVMWAELTDNATAIYGVVEVPTK